MMKHYGVKRERVNIIYESGEHILNAPADNEVLHRHGLFGKKYVLAVGSRSPHKNFSAVIRAAESLQDLNIAVVVAGGSNSRIFAGSTFALPNLVLTGYVTDGHLRALYSHAECFVFPSLYEGFGLPPLEAMHCGCPVVVSNRASLPEVCGDAAVYFDPSDPSDLAKQLRRVLSSEALRLELRAAGTLRAASFTWRRAAESLNELVRTTWG